MSKDKNPSSPTLIRFQQDLSLNGLEERTQQSYGRAVRKLSEFLKREPDSASEDDLRNYLLFIKNDLKWASSTINFAQQGLKKYFSITCPRDWATLKLVRARGEFKLSTVISIGEVHTLLKLIEKPSMLCFFMLTFTVPAEFRMFMRSHPRECYKALFEAAKETLFALAKDPEEV